MECERLNRLVRSWYIQVQNEALAPARMVEFMEKHMMDCDVCLTDPDVRYEVKKISSIVLPPSKMIKKPKQEEAEAEDKAASPPVFKNGDSGNGDAEGEAAPPPVFKNSDSGNGDVEDEGLDPELAEEDV